jgi:hypothetical protein
VILKSDVSLLRLILQTPFREFDLVDQHSVEGNCDHTVQACDVHGIPFSGWLGGIRLRCDSGKDASGGVMMMEFLLACGISDLHFDHRSDGVQGIGHIEIEAAVSTCFVFVFEGDCEVAVGLLGPEVVAIAFPIRFARARGQDESAFIIDLPVTGCVPVAEGV